MIKKSELRQHIHDAGMQLIDEVMTCDIEEQENDYDEELHKIVRRCHELIVNHPEKASLFEEYIRKQQEEYDILAHTVICATLVIKKVE